MTDPVRHGNDRWMGHQTVTLIEEGMRVDVVPGRGGKVVSLVGPDGAEWLARIAEGRTVGGGFTDAEMCGWDECSPTIDRCVVDGRTYRDHGDLWDAAWRVIDQRPAALTLEADGSDVALRFQRRIEVRPGGVAVTYRVESLEDRAWPVLWAWHPQFAVDAGARVQMLGVNAVVDAFDSEQREFPLEGALPMPAPGTYRKVWSARHDRPTAAILERGDGRSLRLTWEGDAVRWLGVWLDHRAFAPGPVIALEPSTGWFDDAARAADNGSVAILGPGETLTWSLTLGFE